MRTSGQSRKNSEVTLSSQWRRSSLVHIKMANEKGNKDELVEWAFGIPPNWNLRSVSAAVRFKPDGR